MQRERPATNREEKQPACYFALTGVFQFQFCIIYHVNTAANNAGHSQAARAVTDGRACGILIKATIGVRHIMTNLPYLRAQRA